MSLPARALDLPQAETFSAGAWTVAGPLRTGNYIIRAGDEVIAVVQCQGASGLPARSNAILMSRAANMRAVLEHLLTELEADDEGIRFADEIRMIREELSRGQGNRADHPQHERGGTGVVAGDGGQHPRRLRGDL